MVWSLHKPMPHLKNCVLNFPFPSVTKGFSLLSGTNALLALKDRGVTDRLGWMHGPAGDAMGLATRRFNSNETSRSTGVLSLCFSTNPRSERPKCSLPLNKFELNRFPL
ncbi:unnamed protein product [Brassica napus]|uniref:(rape) hypothetical protein n=1 Tax=Brassica napus TaxID=3708 RepID=A0A816SKG1_BRANA|nr:unnamed protein product [Brassica napus]